MAGKSRMIKRGSGGLNIGGIIGGLSDAYGWGKDVSAIDAGDVDPNDSSFDARTQTRFKANNGLSKGYANQLNQDQILNDQQAQSELAQHKALIDYNQQANNANAPRVNEYFGQTPSDVPFDDSNYDARSMGPQYQYVNAGGGFRANADALANATNSDNAIAQNLGVSTQDLPAMRQSLVQQAQSKVGANTATLNNTRDFALSQAPYIGNVARTAAQRDISGNQSGALNNKLMGMQYSAAMPAAADVVTSGQDTEIGKNRLTALNNAQQLDYFNANPTHLADAANAELAQKKASANYTNREADKPFPLGNGLVQMADGSIVSAELVPNDPTLAKFSKVPQLSVVRPAPIKLAPIPAGSNGPVNATSPTVNPYPRKSVAIPPAVQQVIAEAIAQAAPEQTTNDYYTSPDAVHAGKPYNPSIKAATGYSSTGYNSKRKSVAKRY